MTSALLGFSGFVGQTLLKQTQFNWKYNSKNIESIRGETFDTIVCAAAPAQKWIANKNPEWYAVNRNGDNSLDYRAYVDYYQWLSPFHPEAREHIINNAKKIMEVNRIQSVHLDYVRYPDVILGADLQPKYNIIQDKELAEYDYDYHPIAREKFKEIFNKDPLDLKNPELSTEWRQFRLNAISTLVNEIVEIANKKNVNVTAAVFPFPEMSRQMVRQAWNDWNLFKAYPMLYQNFYKILFCLNQILL